MSFDLDPDKLQRALGIYWNVHSDTFTFLFQCEFNTPWTKRGILRVICSLFDPLGFLIPFILVAKILLQELWRKDYGWDEQHCGANGCKTQGR